jgi:flagellar biosynthesis protein FlhB
MAEQAAERTELPTAKRLQDARQKGNVPQVNEIVSVATLLGLIAVIAISSQYLAGWATTLTREGMSCRMDVFTNSDIHKFYQRQDYRFEIVISLPILTAITICAVFMTTDWPELHPCHRDEVRRTQFS